ncbi:hypothetical protein BH09VER1_BH09VER1_13540 [soil metagenome]
MIRRFSLAFALAATLACAATPDSPTFSHAIQSGFPKWDRDHDGMLSMDEIEWSLASPEIKGADAAALAAMYRATRVKNSPLKAPVAVATLEEAASQHAAAGKNPDDESTDVQNADLAGSYARALERISKTPHTLFADKIPHLESFRQGKIGSCFCLAPMAALIYRDPAEVARRFTPEKDGFTVQLNDHRKVWVTVPTDGEIAISSTTGTDGYWSTVYEKAIGQMRMEDKGVPGPPLRAATEGSAGKMIGVLTSREFTRFSCSPWRKPDITEEARAALLDQLRALLREGTEKHQIMTVGTGTKGVKVPSLSFSHAYAVLGYDAATDCVTIRDPHNQNFTPKGDPGLKNGYVVARGIFHVPLADAVQIMGGFAFEQPVPAKATTGPDSDNVIGM